MFRIQYKQFSRIEKNFVLVDSEIDAHEFSIEEGCIVFYGKNGLPVFTLPPTFWFICEQIEAASTIVPPTAADMSGTL